MKLEIKIIRDTFTDTTTIGKMYLNGEFFCYTLEDTARDYGIKIKGKTCIPRGLYKVILTMSNRFKRIMPMIYTEDNKYELKSKGISFKGIRIHGGNTHLNTDGCVLVAYNKISDEKIYGTAEHDLTEILKKYDEITLEIENLTLK